MAGHPRGQSHRALSAHARRPAGDEVAAVRPHREHLVQRRSNGQHAGRGPLHGVQGRTARPHACRREGAWAVWHHRQRRLSGDDRHGVDARVRERRVAGAPRRQLSRAAARHLARGRGPRLLCRVLRGRLHHGRVVRYQRRRPHDMKEGTQVSIALVAALVLGIAIAASGNATLLDWSGYLVPIGALWINAIRMTVIPLVIALIITGVASTSDVNAIGRLGGRTLAVFVGLSIGVAIIAVPVAPAIFAILPRNLAGHPPLPPGAAEAAQQLGTAGGAPTFGAWLTSLIPPNPIAAAANGAIVPLIIFTLLLGLAIAHSPAPARERLVDFFAAFRDAMLTLVRWVIAVAPIGVFALLLPLAARSGAALAGGVGFYIAAYSLANLVASLALYPVAALLGRVPIKRFARAALPA